MTSLVVESTLDRAVRAGSSSRLLRSAPELIARLKNMQEDPVDVYEAALRRLPEAHSLVLRLVGAGVADHVMCDYLRIEPEGLETLIEVAIQKLAAELHTLVSDRSQWYY